MTTYLLTWNPQKWAWNNLEEAIKECKETGSFLTDWSCGITTKIEPGDRFFHIKQGKIPKGIIGSGTIISKPYTGKHWDGSKKKAIYVEVKFDTLLNPYTEAILDREELNVYPFSDMHWDAQSSGTTIPDHVAEALEEIWKEINLERLLSINLIKVKQNTRFNNVNFWWVNHKQTYKDELAGGYIWSPKINKDGSINQTYLNLPKTNVNDIIFSFANGEIKAVGVIKAKCYQSDRPSSFRKVGEQWDKDGWQVPVDWVYLESPFSPKKYIDEIVPLLPEKYSPIQNNGNGNQGCYLAKINFELGALLLSIAEIEDISSTDLVEETVENVLEEEELDYINKQKIPETEKQQLVKARIGQGLFKNRVQQIENSCRLTGVTDKRFLVASHIKPWRKSTNEEKLDGHNGLLLSPHVDKLFDNGWITFSDKGDILCSNVEVIMLMKSWGLDHEMNVGNFTKKQQEYLDYHRTNIFAKKI